MICQRTKSEVIPPNRRERRWASQRSGPSVQKGEDARKPGFGRGSTRKRLMEKSFLDVQSQGWGFGREEESEKNKDGQKEQGRHLCLSLPSDLSQCQHSSLPLVFHDECWNLKFWVVHSIRLPLRNTKISLLPSEAGRFWRPRTHVLTKIVLVPRPALS